ncbi:hypothetical protein APR12_004378 [Nocardia amikacinitolerans]|uniref:hypothetical protein n=1 Tax=Nocardia amikacinitolerans TaxID=756689 RepID=UPI00082E2A49|nr:hypothetical protein [Nocardia amikacinitolerans]MCP2319015.1 hypothetical protein [Nocardia amikacinitolerans]
MTLSHHDPLVLGALAAAIAALLAEDEPPGPSVQQIQDRLAHQGYASRPVKRPARTAHPLRRLDRRHHAIEGKARDVRAKRWNEIFPTAHPRPPLQH